MSYRRLTKSHRGRKKGDVILIRETQGKRSARAKQLDARLKAKLAENTSQWSKNPSRFDMKGVDYPGAKAQSHVVLKQMTDAAVLKSQKGMDRRIAGWKLGKYRLYLLYYQIFNQYWWRIESPSGKLIERMEGHKPNNYADVCESLGKAVERLTGNKKVAKEFYEPKKLKRKNQQLTRGLFDAHKDREIVKKFTQRFTFEKNPQKDKFSDGLAYSNDRAVALVLNERLMPTHTKKMFRQVAFNVSAKVNPKTRSAFKSKEKYGTKNILIGDDVFRGEKLWNALMVLNIKQPIKFVKAKTGILSISDADGQKILVAPLVMGSYGLGPEEILSSLPLSKILKTGKKWGKKEATGLLKRVLKRTRKDLLKEAKKAVKAAKSKSYLETFEKQDEWVNNELCHSGTTENYLSLMEHIKKLQGTKVTHREIFEPYHNNNVWKNGKLLI